jgi:putative Holliday junction resolvase
MFDSRTFLGFDFGTKKIGVAVGQAITKTATPLAKILNNEVMWSSIADLINNWRPAALIVGIPKIVDENQRKYNITKTVKIFIGELKERFNLPVYTIDEALTTKTARAEIYAVGGYKALTKECVDSVAAKVILESWMYENCHHE